MRSLHHITPGDAVPRPQTATPLHYTLALMAVWIPFLGALIALGLAWNREVGVLELSLLAGMYIVTTLGVEVGFHRQFAHASFCATNSVRLALAIAGSMAAEGPVVFWVAIHRKHHRYSDHSGDPHSPHLQGNLAFGWLRGLFHAHLGWLFRPLGIEWREYAPDLLRDRAVFAVHCSYGYWVLVGVALPAVIGGVVHRSWAGAASGFLWGGLVRIFLVHHGTWSVNSLCHSFGSRSFDTRDRSTNNVWLSLLTMGGAWHHNHHALPASATTSAKWWQIDPSWWFIAGLEAVGLVYKVNRPHWLRPPCIRARPKEVLTS